MLFRHPRTLLVAPALFLAGGVARAQAHTAHFDGNSEGGLGTSYFEDGITFSDLDRYLGSAPDPFVTEDASGTLAGYPGFTPPMTLGFGGWSPGPGAAFSRCGTFRVIPPAVFGEASLNFYVAGSSSAGNTVTLEARLAGSLVASDFFIVPGTFGPHHFELQVSGADFDELKVVGTGPANSGSFFALVDTVVVGGGVVGSGYCFGDGSGSSCPCGNNGGAGEGCANSGGTGGLVWASGSDSVAADDLTFSASGLLPLQPALLFAGHNAINGGNGIPFGDGLRCAGQSVVRLGVETPDPNGDADWGPGLGALGGWISGDTRYFQVWYRDPGGPCGSGFNLTNGVEVTFTF